MWFSLLGSAYNYLFSMKQNAEIRLIVFFFWKILPFMFKTYRSLLYKFCVKKSSTVSRDFSFESILTCILLKNENGYIPFSTGTVPLIHSVANAINSPVPVSSTLWYYSFAKIYIYSAISI